jgi:hypothetical protein
MEAPFRPPVSEGTFWCFVFDGTGLVSPNVIFTDKFSSRIIMLVEYSQPWCVPTIDAPSISAGVAKMGLLAPTAVQASPGNYFDNAAALAIANNVIVAIKCASA